MSAADSSRTVAVWRTELLSGSETFVRNQVDSLSAWTPVLIGARRIDSALARASDVVAFEASGRGVAARRSFRILRRSTAVQEIIRRSGAEVLHAHFADDAGLIAPTARRLRIPLIVTVHGFDATGTGRGAWWAEMRRRRREALSQARRVVAVSNFMADRVMALGVPSHKIDVLSTGVSIDAAPPSRPDRERRYDLVFVGRLVEKKGVADLLRAVSLLGRPLRSSRVAVVGEGPLRAELEAFADAEGLDVAFLGSRSPAEVAATLSDSRIFVGPSRTASNGDSEGFGMVFLEAALHHLPVVSYRHGGVPEAVVDTSTGLLAEEGNVSELSEKIRVLLTDDDLARVMGRAGHQRVVADFDVRERTRDLERVYESVTGAGA